MKNRNKSLIAIYFAYFLDYFGYAIVFGLFGPLLLSPDFEMFSPETSLKTRHLALGVLFAVYPLMQLIFAPVFGDVADHFGRKKIFLILNCGVIVGYFLSGVAIFVHNLPLLLISRILTGTFSSNRTICMASLSDLYHDEKSRSKAYGIIATLGGVSWIISILVGGIFAKALAPEIPFWITTGLALLSLLILLFLFHETLPQNVPIRFEPFKGIRPIATCFKIEGIKPLYFFYFMMMMGWGINLLWLNPYTLSRYPVSHEVLFGLLASTGLVWSFGSSVINEFLIKRYNPKQIALIGTGGLIAAFTLCALMKTFVLFAIFTLIASVLGALAWTNALSAISLAAPEEMQGKVMGISQSFASIAFMIAPLLAGMLAGVNINLVYPIAAFFILISFTILRLAPTYTKETYESKV